MQDEIVNRVANSKLITIDLEDYYPQGNRVLIDIAPWLLEGIVLKETDFRAAVKAYDWSKHKDDYIAITCSTDAIIPAWAFVFVSLQVAPFAKKTITGSLDQLESVLYDSIIRNLDVSEFAGKPIIIKGCSNKPVPQNAYIFLGQKLALVAKSIMYGEACSAVPLFKNK